ncbi:hypothetical protein OGATHE_002080 [Ogataea polymorpha]|uniref:Uncharacterized protein n=1 Tax=Ogataea polymorpha TaxID=460523 RepID=A0A9P8PM92_9ASCO|nr:hypothetical protein OGATHE_002080 [Ogataea polymorpha]
MATTFRCSVSVCATEPLTLLWSTTEEEFFLELPEDPVSWFFVCSATELALAGVPGPVITETCTYFMDLNWWLIKFWSRLTYIS